MNVILAKEYEESNSPTLRKVNFTTWLELFLNNYDVIEESYNLR